VNAMRGSVRRMRRVRRPKWAPIAPPARVTLKGVCGSKPLIPARVNDNKLAANAPATALRIATTRSASEAGGKLSHSELGSEWVADPRMA
jgi:hypothetical protein